MAFDIKEHHERQRIIAYGKSRWPLEKNITKLYQMAAVELGIEVKVLSTATANHLPTPEDSAKENPQSALSTICPKCSKKSYVLHGLCKSCKDAEDGKYKTMFKCYECQYQEKSEEPMVIWLQRLNVDFKVQTKASLGVKIITDEGLK